MRVILADDQPEVRSALRLLLEEKPNVDVIGEAGSSFELLLQVKLNCPDLILFDWELPGTKPKELLSALRTLCPHLSVVALSSQPQVRPNAISAGASNFVCKSDPPEMLWTAIHACYHDGKS